METKKSELLFRLGVGIILEGLIGFAMFMVSPPVEAINSFLTMILVSFILGCFTYISLRKRQKKRMKTREQF